MNRLISRFFFALVALLSFTTNAMAIHEQSHTSGTFIDNNTSIKFGSSDGSFHLTYYVPMNTDYTVKIQRYFVKQGSEALVNKKYWSCYIRTDDGHTTMSTSDYTISPELKRYAGGYDDAWNKKGLPIGSSTPLTAVSFGNDITLNIKANPTVGDKIEIFGQAVTTSSHLNNDYAASVDIVIGAYSYRLKYDANGGNGAPGDQTVAWTSDYEHESTHTFTLSSTIPTRTGYTFDGWYDAVSGGNKIIGSTTLTGIINEEVVKTLYAHWKLTTYTATFNPDGGSVDPTSKKYDLTQSITFPTATRVGYKMTGWKVTSVDTNSSGWTVGATYAVGATSPSGAYGDVTFEAQWADLYKYTVTYDYNGGTKNGKSSTTEGLDWSDQTSFTIPYSHLYDKTIYPSKGNRILAGWYTKPSGGTAAFINEVSLAGIGHTEVTKTIYAIWCNNIVGSIDHNGTIENGSQCVKEWDSSKAMAFHPSTGYEITGVTEKIGTGSASAIAGLTFPMSSYTYPAGKTPDNEIAVNVTTTAITYTLTFNAGEGGSVSPSSKNYTIEDAIELPTPTKAGHTFTGWKVTTAAGNWAAADAVYTGTVAAGKYGSATLTAQWTEGGYTATFNANGGTVSPASASFKVTGKLELPTPAWKGHTFKGWKVTSESAGSWTKGDTYNAGELSDKWGDVTFTAQWEAIPKGDLKITVKGLEDGDNAVITVVSETTGLEHTEYTISVQSSANTATIKNLYEGSYTVTSGGWQWKYTVSDTNPKTATVSKDVPAEVTFTLSAKSDLPKHDESSKVNVLSKE